MDLTMEMQSQYYDFTHLKSSLFIFIINYYIYIMEKVIDIS